MSKTKLPDEKWFQRHFPSKHARDIADKAIDAISVTQPMHVFLDAWIAAYVAAGGRTDLKFDT